MKTELYKKVWIKSVEDLPKDTGSYYVHDRSYSEDFIITDYFDKEQNGIFHWLQNIDWYLQPIEQIYEEAEPVTISRDQVLIQDKTTFNPETIKPDKIELTDEEIERQSEIEIDPGVKDDFQHGRTQTALRRRIWSYGAKYARDQIKVSPYEGRTTLRPESPLNINPVELTDEEIIDYALNYISHKDLKPANKGLIKDALIIGAKWYRNQIEVLIMNELVKFLKWFRGHEDLNELVVEDYLKPKNQ
jgi:hypothetical protein